MRSGVRRGVADAVGSSPKGVAQDVDNAGSSGVRAVAQPTDTPPATARRSFLSGIWRQRPAVIGQTSMEPVVRPLRTHELRRASHLLAHSFVDDPFIGYFLRNPRRREAAFPPFFRTVLHELAGAGALYGLEAGVALVGVA